MEQPYSPPNLVGFSEYNEIPPVINSGKQCCGLREFAGLSWIGRVYRDSITGFTKTLDEKDIFLSAIKAMWACNPTDQQQRIARGLGVMQAGTPLIGCAHVFFTQAVGGIMTGHVDYGERFEAFLLKNSLGTVQRFGPNRNTNSGNMITTFVWAPNHEAVWNYVAREWK